VVGNEGIHLPGDVRGVAHDVVPVVDSSHFVILHKCAGDIELVGICCGFVAQAVEFRRDDQGGCDAFDVVAVGSPRR